MWDGHSSIIHSDTEIVDRLTITSHDNKVSKCVQIPANLHKTQLISQMLLTEIQESKKEEKTMTKLHLQKRKKLNHPKTKCKIQSFANERLEWDLENCAHYLHSNEDVLRINHGRLNIFIWI